jgi:hypothetical protein
MRKLSFLKTGYTFLALIIIITLAEILYGQRGYPMDNCETSSISSTEIVEYPNLNDSMPHYQYKRIEDSVNNSRPKEIAHHTGSGWGTMGIHIGYYNDSKTDYYIGSKSYFLKNSDYAFFEKSGKNYVRSISWNKIQNGNCSGVFVEKPTPYKFVMDDVNKGNGHGMFLVPVKPFSGKILNIAMMVIGLLAVIAGVYIFFGVFIHFLVAISKGNAFSERNISRLYTVGNFLLIIGLIPFIFQSLFFLMTKANLPPEVDFSFFRAFFEGADSIRAGLIALLFASAFKRGFELQKDQELTV